MEGALPTEEMDPQEAATDHLGAGADPPGVGADPLGTAPDLPAGEADPPEAGADLPTEGTDPPGATMVLPGVTTGQLRPHPSMPSPIPVTACHSSSA